jgi:hypothetical protein
MNSHSRYNLKPAIHLLIAQLFFLAHLMLNT